MTPKWQKLASLAQEICTLWFQFFGAVFASKGYPIKNILDTGRKGSRNSIGGLFLHLQIRPLTMLSRLKKILY